jgi:glutathione S-transferase
MEADRRLARCDADRRSGAILGWSVNAISRDAEMVYRRLIQADRDRSAAAANVPRRAIPGRMPHMQLYSAPLSLFSRKVEIALHEKSLAFERVMVPFTQAEGYTPKHPVVVAANPKCQVPVLIDGALMLFDSTVILEYLEDAYPEPALYPASPAERARCRLLELEADEIMLPPLRDLMHRTTPPDPDPERQHAREAAAREAETVLRGEYDALEARIVGKAHFCGALSVADIALFTGILYVKRLGGPSLVRHPALAGWYGRLAARPAFARIIQEIAAADRELSWPVEAQS